MQLSLSSYVGLSKTCINSWLSDNTPDLNLLTRIVDSEPKANVRKMISLNLTPANYLLKHPALLKYASELIPEEVKQLDNNVYREHLLQLINTDRLSDIKAPTRISYDAEMFIVFRYSNKKTEITHAKKMYNRKIMHHTYETAKIKLREMACRYEPTFIEMKNDCTTK
jgi:hypothetical protein